MEKVGPFCHCVSHTVVSLPRPLPHPIYPGEPSLQPRGLPWRSAGRQAGPLLGILGSRVWCLYDSHLCHFALLLHTAPSLPVLQLVSVCVCVSVCMCARACVHKWTLCKCSHDVVVSASCIAIVVSFCILSVCVLLYNYTSCT